MRTLKVPGVNTTGPASTNSDPDPVRLKKVTRIIKKDRPRCRLACRLHLYVNMLNTMVILGASGNLASRYLFPALMDLQAAGDLPPDFQLIAVAIEGWDTDRFREHLAATMEAPAHPSHHSGDGLLSRLQYCQADVRNPSDVERILRPIEEPVAVYFALPSRLFAPAGKALSETGLPEGSRIVIEKPFGEGLSSAQQLNRLLHRAFPEEAVFRIDHFLHKQTIQNILGLRFANRVFEPLWNSHHINRVEIVWDETRTLDSRASYYDSAGALRDMIQNHLLQLLALVAMEVPHSLEQHNLRDRKVDVLRAVRRFSAKEVEENTYRGCYQAGRIHGQEVPGYADEDGVTPQRKTETLAQVALAIDNWRWAGVPFVLRSGKALKKEKKEIAVHFKPVPHLAFGQQTAPVPNVLRIKAVPDSLAFEININGPGDPFELERVELAAKLAPQEPSAYGRLVLEVLHGNPTLSIRGDEAEECWRIVEPILETWKNDGVPLFEYPAGSEGPALQHSR